MPYTPVADDDLVERLARMQLDRRMRYYRMTDADWAQQIAFHREMLEAFPDYLQGRSMVTDAFRHVIDVLESAHEMGLTLVPSPPSVTIDALAFDSPSA